MDVGAQSPWFKSCLLRGQLWRLRVTSHRLSPLVLPAVLRGEHYLPRTGVWVEGGQKFRPRPPVKRNALWIPLHYHRLLSPLHTNVLDKAVHIPHPTVISHSRSHLLPAGFCPSLSKAPSGSGAETVQPVTYFGDFFHTATPVREEISTYCASQQRC